MTDSFDGRLKRSRTNHILLLFTLFSAPTVFWSAFIWINGLIPVVLALFIAKFGWKYTNGIVLMALLAATLVSTIVSGLDTLLFTSLFIPVGYLLAYSIFLEEKPWVTGLRIICTLFLLLSITFSILYSGKDVSFWEGASQSITIGIDGIIDVYRQNSEVSAEEFSEIEQRLSLLKIYIPKIIPAFLGTILIFWGWSLLVISNYLLPRFGCAQPWEGFRFWTLPEKLIWVVIIAGLMMFFGENLTFSIGINVLFISLFIYSFQGLAVLVFMLDKWKVPRFMKLVIYLMAVLQTFGTFLLIVTGVADVWMNFRKVNNAGNIE